MTNEKIKAALDHQINDVKWYGEEGQKALDALRSILPLLEAQTSAGAEIEGLGVALDRYNTTNTADMYASDIRIIVEAARRYEASQQTRGEVPEGYVVVPSRICMRDESGKSNPEHFAWMGRALMALPKGHGGSNGTMEMYGNAILSTSPAPPVAGKDRGE